MTRIRIAGAVAALAIALSGGVARAEQKLGVTIYPGATLVAERSGYVNAAVPGADASCYRTPDAAAAVLLFVASQPGFEAVGENLLRRGKVDVVVRPPAVDPKTGAVGAYTHFCIMLAPQ